MKKKFQSLSYKKKVFVFVLLYSLLFCVSFACALAFPGKALEKYSLHRSLPQSTESVIDAEQLKESEKSGYTISGDSEYTVQNNDPQIILPMSGEKIVRLKIVFSETNLNSMKIQVFYALNTGEGFCEKNSESVTVKRSNRECEVLLFQEGVTALRLDIGSEAGETFGIDHILVNEQPQMSLSEEILSETSWRLVWLWTQIYFFISGFVILHFLVPVTSIYQFIFKKRWIIAGLFLAFFTVNRLHGDSIAVYDQIIQPGAGSEYVEPIWGEERTIRSDEYVVDTPARLSSTYGEDAFGKYNTIQRGTETLNGVSGIYLGYSTLGKSPFQFAYLVMSREFAFSFCWYAPIILTFMTAFELCLIIARRKKIVAFAGACLIGLSNFFLWWGFPPFLLGVQGALVCAYHFLIKDKKYQKVLLALGLGLSFAYYVFNMYPPWIVPMGYVSLLFVIWMLHENWERLKKFRLFDYALLVGAFLFAGSMILYYFKINGEYLNSIMNTVYPGQRFETGGYYLPNIFTYFQGFMYGFKDLGNPCEISGFLCLFPIPLIAALYQWIRSKRKDWLMAGMLGISAVFLIFCTVGIPGWLAKITLLSNCQPTRVVHILGIVEVYLMIRCLGMASEEQKKFPIWLAVVISAATAAAGWAFSAVYYPDYLPAGWAVVAAAVVVAAGTSLLVMRKTGQKKILCLALSGISIITAMSIRPISIGLDAIFSKPAAEEIQRICQEDPDAKWMSCSNDVRASGFMVACGAPTVNSTNTYPNLELWEKLDKTHQYEEVYNRLAHISIELVHEETSFELIQDDYFILRLSYDDLDVMGCDYIFTTEEMESASEEFVFEEIYEEDGSYIYRIVSRA